MAVNVQENMERRMTDWNLEMEVLKQHLAKHEGTSSQRFFEQLYQKKLEAGSVFPQHVWKPYASYFVRYKKW